MLDSSAKWRILDWTLPQNTLESNDPYVLSSRVMFRKPKPIPDPLNVTFVLWLSRSYSGFFVCLLCSEMSRFQIGSLSFLWQAPRPSSQCVSSWFLGWGNSLYFFDNLIFYFLSLRNHCYLDVGLFLRNCPSWPILEKYIKIQTQVLMFISKCSLFVGKKTKQNHNPNPFTKRSRKTSGRGWMEIEPGVSPILFLRLPYHPNKPASEKEKLAHTTRPSLLARQFLGRCLLVSKRKCEK